MPLTVAISIPIGAWSPYLFASLSSIAAQQTEQIYVAILNASGDERVQDDISACGIRVDYQRDGLDDGQAAAIAEGWLKTKSDLVTWLNADDLLTKGAIASIVTYFESRNDVDAFYGNSTLSVDDVIIGLHPEVAPISNLLERSNIISQPSCFVKRSLVDAIGGLDTALIYTMDWDLWLRLYNFGARFVYSEDVYSHVTLAQTTKTASLGSVRLRECAAILNRSQSKLKTAIGVAAIIRQNLRSYGRKAKPYFLSFSDSETINIPFVNFHSTQKSRLEFNRDISTEERLLLVVPHGELVKNEGRLTIVFDKPIASGDSVFISFENMPKTQNSISAYWS